MMEDEEEMVTSKAIGAPPMGKARPESAVGGGSLDSLLNAQSAEGTWGSSTLKIVTKCLSPDQAKKLEALLKKRPEDEVKIILTVIALEILSKKFSEKKDEWKLIAKKGKKWLKSAEQAKGDAYKQLSSPGIQVV